MLWGGAFFFGKVSVAVIPPMTLVLGRVGIAAAALWLLAGARGVAMPSGARAWAAFAAMGILDDLLPFALIFRGQTRIPSALAAIPNATPPLWGVVLAHFLARDERLTARRAAGAAPGFLGVAAMMAGPALPGAADSGIVPSGVAASLDAPSMAGQLAVVGAALSYALAGIFGRRFRGQDPLATATGQVSMSALLALPAALLLDRPWGMPAPGPAAWGALLGLALLSTALAYVIFFRVLATAGTTNILLVTFLIPVSAAALGSLVLGERLESRHVAGTALVALGLAAMDGRPLALLAAALPRRGRGAG